MAWVRALTALWRATRSERTISTVAVLSLEMPVASPGLDRSGGGVGIDRVALATPAAGGPVGLVDLPHALAVGGQEAGQAGAVAAGALHSPGDGLAQALGPHRLEARLRLIA
jgi:hypothetical protein